MSCLIPRPVFLEADAIETKEERKQRLSYLNKYSILPPKESRVQERLERKINSICEMYKDGMSLRQIASIHKTSHETIRQILNNHGILTKYKDKQRLIAVGTKRTTTTGYIQVYIGTDSPGANKLGWIFEHRLIMQEHLGRPLLPWEIVHHKDRNKSNNKFDNLELTTITDHATCIKCPYYEYYRQATGNETINPRDLTKS